MNAPRDRLTTALADRYRVERELGAGGMATVYLAHDIRHDRDVAIKVLHPDLGAALGAERFLSEIRTTARLQHPHILPLLDSGEADGLLYYVMPLVTGETLRSRLERERQLPIADAVLIAREVADALGYAHGLGVIHRDIKPENILLQGGHALVADFGIALAVQHAGGQRMTQTGLSLGTPQYMSPEQAMGETHDRRPQRHLRARCGDIRDAGGRGAVHGAQRAGHCCPVDHRGTAWNGGAAESGAGACRGRGVARTREVACGPLRRGDRLRCRRGWNVVKHGGTIAGTPRHGHIPADPATVVAPP